MSDMVFQPSSSKPLFVRPLDKGMFLDRPAQLIPEGGFVELKNLIANQEGPRRRPGYVTFAGGAASLYNHIDIVSVWRPGGDQITVLLTEKNLMKIQPLTGVSEVAWAYSVGTATISGGVNVTVGTAALQTNDVEAGDIFRVGSTEALILAIVDQTHLTLASALADGAGQAYSVQKAFGPGNNPLVDWAVMGGMLALADGKRPLMKYNPTLDTITAWTVGAGKMPGGIPFIPATVCAFANRMWTAFTYDATDLTQRQRIRWSALADNSDFSIATNYLDLPYSSGAILRLLPLGQFLVAYLSDCVYIGSPTSYPLLPIRFDPLDTGGVGLLGAKAVVSYLGGHCFVGQDDIYLLTQDGTSRIGSPVIKKTIEGCKYPERIMAVSDPYNHRICFGFPQGNPYIEVIWSYDYRSKSWGFEPTATYMITNPVISSNVSWDSLTGTWDTLAVPTWDGFVMGSMAHSVFVEYQKKIWRQSPDATLDYGAIIIPVELVTPDHDFNLPDTNKNLVRFSMKIDADPFPSSDLTFSIHVSTDRGKRWKTCGTLVIPAGKDEGYVTFQSLGSTFRIKASSTSPVSSYSISEYGMRVRLSGNELGLGASQ